MLKSEVIWEETPPEMSDTRWIFNMKNRFSWSDRQLDRGKQYSESFTREGISKMMKSGELTIDSGVKLIELLFKENEANDAQQPINVSIVVKELPDER